LLEKKACSPLENTNSPAQSRQVRARSWNTLSRSSWCLQIAPAFLSRPPAPNRTTDRCRQEGRHRRPYRVGPGTHDAHNSGGVKRFGPLNLVRKRHRAGEIRTNRPIPTSGRRPWAHGPEVPTGTRNGSENVGKPGNRSPGAGVGAPCLTSRSACPSAARPSPSRPSSSSLPARAPQHPLRARARPHRDPAARPRRRRASCRSPRPGPPLEPSIIRSEPPT
jgi:hypothetical protein